MDGRGGSEPRAPRAATGGDAAAPSKAFHANERSAVRDWWERLALCKALLLALVMYVFVALEALDLLGTFDQLFLPHLAREGAEVVALVLLLMITFGGRRRRLRIEGEAADALAMLASTDPLTSLPNRRGFVGIAETEIQRCDRYGRRCSLVLWDLNGFKAVNDSAGHLAGDAVLQGFAEILTAEVRESDTPARLGGDEFAALVVEADASTGHRLTARVAASARLVVPVRGVSAASGIATYPDDGRTFDELFAVADARMYADKHRPHAPARAPF